jgi:hypothetical protein
MFAFSMIKVVVGASCLIVVSNACADDSALDLFKTRIAPILRSPDPSSCAECHLSGVDLKHYIGPTQQQTFASLRSAGLINVDDPDQSKLLEFIRRAPEKATPVSAKARTMEYEAFRAWIRAAVKDPELAAAKTDVDVFGPAVPVEVIRHTRQDRVLRSFVATVWSEVGRCVGCHSPEMNRSRIGFEGTTEAEVEAISWIVPRDPGATLQKLIDSGCIDLDEPESSLVLTKPAGLEDHGGGPKFPVGSRTDKNFRLFLNDYAASVRGEYNSVDELPAAQLEVAFATGQQLRITDLPADFDQKLLRADIYRRIGDRWSESRWATADGPIAGEQQLWQNMLMAVAPRESQRAMQLAADQPIPGGRYLIKIYIDRDDKTKTNRDYELGEAEFYGQVETDGAWDIGYQPPKIVKAPNRDK